MIYGTNLSTNYISELSWVGPGLVPGLAWVSGGPGPGPVLGLENNLIGARLTH